MKLQRLFSAIAGLTLVASTAAPSFAFMNQSDAESNSADVSTFVETLRKEIAAGNTECTELLDKVNQAVAVIDTKLDGGVADESTYLDARASLLKMRSDLPCLGEQLTQIEGQPVVDGGKIVSDKLLSEQTVDSGNSIVEGGIAGDGSVIGGGMVGGDFGASGFTSGMSGGSVAGSGFAPTGGSFGGGGGGGLSGGGGLGGLSSLGAIGAAVAVGASNDDSPGAVVSRSTP